MPGATCNVPASAVAVTGTVTVVNESAPGFFTLQAIMRAGTPTTGWLYFPKGDVRATGLTVMLGAGYQARIRAGQTRTATEYVRASVSSICQWASASRNFAA